MYLTAWSKANSRVSCVCYAFVHVCLLLPCAHLLRKGWPLGSRLWCLIMSLLLSHWYPGSDVVHDCIYFDSWYLPSFSLLYDSYTMVCPLVYGNNPQGRDLFVFLVSRDCCVALPQGATGMSAVCDCGISCSYSLIILVRRLSTAPVGIHGIH